MTDKKKVDTHISIRIEQNKRLDELRKIDRRSKRGLLDIMMDDYEAKMKKVKK